MRGNGDIELLAQANALQGFIDARFFHQAVKPDAGEDKPQDDLDDLGHGEAHDHEHDANQDARGRGNGRIGQIFKRAE